MGIRDALLGTFGIKQEDYPVFNYRGSKWHFRVQTSGHEKWATSQAALRSLTSAEAAMTQDQLIALVCVFKQEDAKGEVSYPWLEFIDQDRVAEKNRSLVPMLEAAKENPETPPLEVQRAGALGFLDFLDTQPSGILGELIEFYIDEIKPLGDAMSMVRYVCTACISDRPGYDMPIREELEEPPHCEYCGNKTEVHTVLRRSGGRAPLA